MLLAELAAIAAHLVAAERNRRIHRLVAIDPDGACAQRLCDLMRLADIGGPEPLPRPKVAALARLINSSGSVKEIAEITGPKISSCAIRMLSCTLANTVGGTK